MFLIHDQIYLTLHFTNLTTFLTLASQNAPLYFALTSVPTVRYGGSWIACREEEIARFYNAGNFAEVT